MKHTGRGERKDLFRLPIKDLYHLTVKLLQLVCLLSCTFNGLQGTFHSVQSVLTVCLLKHNLTDGRLKQHWSQWYLITTKQATMLIKQFWVRKKTTFLSDFWAHIKNHLIYTGCVDCWNARTQKQHRDMTSVSKLFNIKRQHWPLLLPYNSTFSKQKNGRTHCCLPAKHFCLGVHYIQSFLKAAILNKANYFTMKGCDILPVFMQNCNQDRKHKTVDSRNNKVNKHPN